MKHLLNNLPTEEITRILEQYKNSLIVETKNFKNLITVKSGNVQPLLNEQNPYPVVKQPKVVTQTTTLSPQEQQKQKQTELINKSKTELATKFRTGSDLPLFDKEIGGKFIGTYKIQGEVKDGVLNESSNLLDSLMNNKSVIFRVYADAGSLSTKKRYQIFDLTFYCPYAPALTVGKPNIVGAAYDWFGIKQKKVYSPNLTPLLINGFCENVNGRLIPRTTFSK